MIYLLFEDYIILTDLHRLNHRFTQTWLQCWSAPQSVQICEKFFIQSRSKFSK